MKHVTGIGGVFFKSENSERLYEWYEKHLGIKREPHGSVMFRWNDPDAKDRPESADGVTVWAIFPQDTKYFNPSRAGFMVNFRVNDLDALVAELKAAGVEVEPHSGDEDYGRFSWIVDADGNRVELWEPPKEKK